MIKPKRGFAALMLLPVVASAALSGCSAGQQVTASDVIQKMRETMKSTQTVQGSVDLSLTLNKDGLKALAGSMMPGAAAGAGANANMLAGLPDSATASVKLWKQSPDKLRVEIGNSTIPGAKGAVAVFDGQKVYAYDPSKNTLFSASRDKLEAKMPDNLKGIVGSADIEQKIDKLIAAADIKLAGTEKVAGLDAYKLDITARPDAGETLGIPQAFKLQADAIIKNVHAVLWVDKDRWMPLKLTVEHTSIGQFTYEVNTIELNKPIDASQFVLKAPDGARTVDLDAKLDSASPKSLTFPQARSEAAKAGWALLQPSYPANATLVGVSSIGTAEKGGYILDYSSPSSDFTLAEGKGELSSELGDRFNGTNAGAGKLGATTVTVRGVQARVFSPSGTGWTGLVWREKESGLWVAIRGKLTSDEAVKIAESLK